MRWIHRRVKQITKKHLKIINFQRCLYQTDTHEFSPFLKEAPTYEEVYKNFKWRIPEYYNIGFDICDKHVIQGRGDFPALIFDDNKDIRTYTFNHLRDFSSQLANVFQSKLNLKLMDRVGILLPQSPETVITHIATYKTACIALPLFTLFGPDALRYRLQNSQTKILVTNIESLEKIDKIKDQLPFLESILVVSEGNTLPPKMGHIQVYDFWKLTEEGSKTFILNRTKANYPALIIYTSGTTGDPKGCLHAHRVLLGHLPGVEFPHNFFPKAGDKFWTPADWSWIGGLIDVLLPSLHHGIPVVAHRANKFDPEEAFYLLEKHSIKNVFMPPTALKMMRNVEAPEKRFKYKLRSIGSGGESLGEQTLEWGRKTFGLTINEFYGQTEANLIVGNCANVMKIKPGSMGKAIPGHVVKIVNQQGQIQPPDTIGIVGVKPDPVAFIEYWKNPIETGKKFSDDGNWILTGDLAKMDEEGYFYFVGREDDLINSAGYRMGPSEIEDCLLKHEAVHLCAVIGAPDELRNEIVKAFIVLKESHKHILSLENGEEELKKNIQSFVKERLAAHEYPREIEFVDSLPMTTTGKIQRKVLKMQEIEKYNMKK